MAIAGVVASLVIAVPAFAQTIATAPKAWGGEGSAMHASTMKPGVAGTVSAVSGTTLTVKSEAMREVKLEVAVLHLRDSGDSDHVP